jgi:TPR repeat protein
MQNILNDQDLDRHLWTLIAHSENPLDFTHYVRHALDRDAGHEAALQLAQDHWLNKDATSLRPAMVNALRELAEAGNVTALYHLGRWHYFNDMSSWLDHDAMHWFEQGRQLGDGRCTTQLARHKAKSDEPAAIAIFYEAIEQGHLAAYCYLADFEKDLHDQHLQKAANSGHPFSMYCWGYHLMKVSKNQGQDQARDIDWIKRAALAGESDACFYLGLMFLHGQTGFDKDTDTGLEWLALGAKYGHANSMGAWGRNLLNESPEKDQLGRRLLFRASMLGDKFAQNTLGTHMLWQGQTPEEQTEGVSWIKAAAMQGHKLAIFRMGESFEYGKGIDQNHDEAAQWYAKGVALGSSECQTGLGYLYLRGRGVPEDDVKAHDLFQLASLQKDPLGTFMLGQSFAYGWGVPKDTKAALECYMQAAERDHSTATFKVGRAYLVGEGIEKNHGAAVRWLKKASKLGNNEAPVFLGLMLLSGDGVEENSREAAHWFRAAANNDSAQGLRELGLLYAAGNGVEQDIAEAQRLMAKAASLDDDEAKEWLEENCPQKPDWLLKLSLNDGLKDSLNE